MPLLMPLTLLRIQRLPIVPADVQTGRPTTVKGGRIKTKLSKRISSVCVRNINPLLFLLLTEQLSNHHGSVLCPVPHHQQPSVTALNQAQGSTLHVSQSLSSPQQLPPATGSPASVGGQLPVEVQTTSPDSVPLQDSWVLGSNVPLETRYILPFPSLALITEVATVSILMFNIY